eukprot:CAMPEP_0176488412 /NCGR_PEP_ID=MMETSP0200_2-20121128/6693_1 /TAXON_ID=947934 /ORGANISM="Chaetoceros sp., Strain GSL56" /LENGTH=60 /DNA_ID=CAMNT_0017885389 /DNA_START=794 /DNA_END=976 /DNA_ORIENTATION=-
MRKNATKKDKFEAVKGFGEIMDAAVSSNAKRIWNHSIYCLPKSPQKAMNRFWTGEFFWFK